jgi:hypothetical protein
MQVRVAMSSSATSSSTQGAGMAVQRRGLVMGMHLLPLKEVAEACPSKNGCWLLSSQSLWAMSLHTSSSQKIRMKLMSSSRGQMRAHLQSQTCWHLMISKGFVSQSMRSSPPSSSHQHQSRQRTTA